MSKSKRTFFFRTSCIEILWTDIRYHKLSLLEIPNFFLVFGDEIREEVPEEIQESGVIVIVCWVDQLAKSAFSGWNQMPRFEWPQRANRRNKSPEVTSNDPKRFQCDHRWWPEMTLNELMRVFLRCITVNSSKPLL